MTPGFYRAPRPWLSKSTLASAIFSKGKSLWDRQSPLFSAIERLKVKSFPSLWILHEVLLWFGHQLCFIWLIAMKSEALASDSELFFTAAINSQNFSCWENGGHQRSITRHFPMDISLVHHTQHLQEEVRRFHVIKNILDTALSYFSTYKISN